MKKPVILITPTQNGDHYQVSVRYNNSVARCGGVPVMCGMFDSDEYVESILDSVDGVLFSGGDDLNPELYGERTHSACGEITADRDTLELKLYKGAVKRGLPILGICRGIQLINVASGGTCIQDIPSEYVRPETCKFPLQHRQVSRGTVCTQKIYIEKDSIFSKIVGTTELMVNTFHHQACKELGVNGGWKVVGRAEDGVIEAIENPSMKFGVAVQWHPEHLIDLEWSQKLFTAFINASAETKR